MSARDIINEFFGRLDDGLILKKPTTEKKGKQVDYLARWIYRLLTHAKGPNRYSRHPRIQALEPPKQGKMIVITRWLQSTANRFSIPERGLGRDVLWIGAE